MDEKKINLGKQYIALAVKDIVKSLDFYQNLGFEADLNCGGVEQKWMILRNGSNMIDLY